MSRLVSGWCQNPAWYNLECFILDAQFQELEAEILENPGAIEPWLIRRRTD